MHHRQVDGIEHGLQWTGFGQLFGGRDHTTVMYAQKKITEYMNERRYVYNQVTEIIGRIKAQGKN